MFEKIKYQENDFETVLNQLKALIHNEYDVVCNFANASALLFQFLKNVNWAGFYFNKNDTLVLGPFNGLPACTRIPSGKGVCGTALKTQKTLYVKDVHAFPGHIACDAASKSEVVIPIIIKNQCFAVLDIDSNQYDNFDAQTIEFLEKFVEILKNNIIE